jgi:hypothetical protein
MSGPGVRSRILPMTTPTTTECPTVLEATGHDTFIDDVTPLRELDSRTGDGLTVTLLWRPGDPSVVLRVDDARTGVRVEFTATAADAADAFRHPFAYAG